MNTVDIKPGSTYIGPHWTAARLVTSIERRTGEDSVVQWLNLETRRSGSSSLSRFAQSATGEAHENTKLKANTERKERHISSGQYSGGFTGPMGIPGAAEYPGSY